jgi:hypothetical protein
MFEKDVAVGVELNDASKGRIYSRGSIRLIRDFQGIFVIAGSIMPPEALRWAGQTIQWLVGTQAFVSLGPRDCMSWM